MTDSRITTRLREIADDISTTIKSHSDVPDKIVTAWEDRIRTIVTELEQPVASSSAYELVAAAEMANVETTETLIHMIAATVLSKLIDEEGGGRSNISFSPADMDAMHQRYVLDATRDGMLTTVSITPREGAFEGGLHVSTASAEGGLSAPPESFYRSQEPIDSGPAKPQADIHVYDRPLWAVRIDGMLVPCSDRNAAERSVSWHTANRTENIVQIENRFCYHDDCPADRCLHVPEQDDTTDDATEATSGD